MTSSTGDPITDQLIAHQVERKAFWLAQTPPDRKAAEQCQQRIDDFLDRRRRPIAVASDGEAVMDDQSPWVIAQGSLTVENISGGPERILTAEQWDRAVAGDGGVE